MVCLAQRLVILSADLLMFCVEAGEALRGCNELCESQAFFCDSYDLNIVCEGCKGQVENFSPTDGASIDKINF